MPAECWGWSRGRGVKQTPVDYRVKQVTDDKGASRVGVTREPLEKPP